MPPKDHPPVILFGCDSCPFTNKVRLVLRIKQIPFSYIPASTLPQPLLTLSLCETPVLAIGRELYCDTSLIIEALEDFFPASQGWRTVYPKFESVDEWTYRGLVRGFASFWTERPELRRGEEGNGAQVYGHIEELKEKNLKDLDQHLAMLEPGLTVGAWAIPTKTPSLADVSLYVPVRCGIDIASEKRTNDLPSGGVKDPEKREDGVDKVFNEEKYPGLWRWFHAFETYIASLPNLQATVPGDDVRWKEVLRQTLLLDERELLLPVQNANIDVQRGLVPGVSVSIALDDTGRDDPIIGTLVKIGVEEVVIMPNEEVELDVRVHFPRLRVVVEVVEGSRS